MACIAINPPMRSKCATLGGRVGGRKGRSNGGAEGRGEKYVPHTHRMNAAEAAEGEEGEGEEQFRAPLV